MIYLSIKYYNMLPRISSSEVSKEMHVIDELSDLEAYCRETKHAEKEVFQIPKNDLRIFHNGITELPGNLGCLGELHLNIPILAQLEGQTSLPVDRKQLKTILITNLHLVSYYFRTHVLLQKSIFLRESQEELTRSLRGILSPLISLSDHLNPGRPVETAFPSDETVEGIIGWFERVMHELHSVNAPREAKVDYLTSDASQSPGTAMPWLLQAQNEQYHQILQDILTCLESIRWSIKSFFVYGSIAKNTIRPGSDIDAVLLLDDAVLEHPMELRTVLSAIMEANAMIRDHRSTVAKGPFHYLFESELASVPPFYRNGIFKHSQSLIGPAVHPDTFCGSESDELYLHSALINKFQKVRHEASRALLGGAEEMRLFYNRCFRHVISDLGNLALAAMGEPVPTDTGADVAKVFPDLRRQFSGVLRAWSTEDIRSHEQVASLVDFYKDVTQRCYGLR